MENALTFVDTLVWLFFVSPLLLQGFARFHAMSNVLTRVLNITDVSSGAGSERGYVWTESWSVAMHTTASPTYPGVVEVTDVGWWGLVFVILPPHPVTPPGPTTPPVQFVCILLYADICSTVLVSFLSTGFIKFKAAAQLNVGGEEGVRSSPYCTILTAVVPFTYSFANSRKDGTNT